MNIPLPFRAGKSRKSGDHHPRSGYQRGQEIVEVALTVGFFMLLLFSLMEGIRFVYSYTATTYLSNEALRYAIVRGNRAGQDSTRSAAADAPATPESIKAYLDGLGLLARLDQTTVTWPDGDKNRGSRVRITVVHGYLPLLLSYFMPNDPVLLSGQTTYPISATTEGRIVY